VTELDRTAFGRLLFLLGDTFNESVSDFRLEAYFVALADLPMAAVQRAMELAIRDARFFPRPVEIREYATGSVDDNAELAWSAVRRLVQRVGYYRTPGETDWPDEPTKRAALELYGGWQALCENLPASGPELLGYRKTFLATYRAYAARVDPSPVFRLGPRPLGGYFDS
jgi:hypothetical protein